MTLLRHLILSIVILAVTAFVASADSSVIIKLVVVNPSPDQVQTAVVKSYLPKEVQPDDVLKKGDLQVIYDAQQGSYFVYGELELKPAEVMELEVELRDVWRISDAEIESLRAESVKYGELLKGTEFADRITFICGGVATELQQLQDSQKASPANPEQKISIFRENLRVLDSVKVDLATARSLLSQSKPFSTRAVWGMILAIIIFLGILGSTFYFVWYRQVKTAPPVEESLYVSTSDQSNSAGGVRRDSGQKNKDAKDVDQLLDEGP